MTAEAFWDWSLAFYADPAVSAACLALQDEHGADVNIVLVLLWLASAGAGPLDADEVLTLDRALSPWRRDVVVPLRSLRRALKGQGEDAVRRAVAAAELEAERSAQRRLVEALPALRPGSGPARSRAVASFRHYGPADSSGALGVLLDRLDA
jgi:uncharacterized protein (TIGR02444 family)